MRRRTIPDVLLGAGGRPRRTSLERVLGRIQILAGQGGRIEAAYLELAAGAFGRMLQFAEARMALNTDASRTEYSLVTNSCLHFMKETVEAGGALMPGVFDPRPAGYIGHVRGQYPDLDFRPGGSLSIEGIQLP